jgi:hypothetical protein
MTWTEGMVTVCLGHEIHCNNPRSTFVEPGQLPFAHINCKQSWPEQLIPLINVFHAACRFKTRVSSDPDGVVRGMLRDVATGWVSHVPKDTFVALRSQDRIIPTPTDACHH